MNALQNSGNYSPAYGHSFDVEAAIVEKKNATTVKTIVI